VPLVFGLYWKRANTNGAMFSIVLGLSSWLLTTYLITDGIVPPQLIGLGLAIFGMIAGSLLFPAPKHQHSQHTQHKSAA
jgi:solute:Na+ symporter, SSS family